MKKVDQTPKRVAISKANAQMVAALGVGAFITVFCLFAAKAVWDLNTYQSRVISAKKLANTQLQKNLDSYNSLARSYRAFNNASTNIIGGVPGAAGDNDGSNAKIVLDALPSSYDFPAYTSSIEKLVAKNNLKITAITGIDDQVNQEGNTKQVTPQEVPMPVSFTVSNANYTGIQALMSGLQASIRPIVIDKLIVTGGGNNISVTIDAHSYYQPGKDVSVTKKVIK